MRTAKVFVSIIGDRHVARQSMDALESAKGFMRGELGHAVELRHTPELTFRRGPLDGAGDRTRSGLGEDGCVESGRGSAGCR